MESHALTAALSLLGAVSQPTPDLSMLGAGDAIRQIVDALLGFALTFLLGAIIAGTVSAVASRAGGNAAIYSGSRTIALGAAIGAAGCGAAAWVINTAFDVGGSISAADVVEVAAAAVGIG